MLGDEKKEQLKKLYNDKSENDKKRKKFDEAMKNEDPETEALKQAAQEQYDTIQQYQYDLEFNDRYYREQIFDLEEEERKEERLNKWNDEKTSFSSGHFIHEIVDKEDLLEDVFNRRGEADRISRLLCDPNTKGPYNIGVIGDWGSGKTSFISYIKDGIQKHNSKWEKDKDKKIKVVEYNAADYSSKILNDFNSSHVEQHWSNIFRVLVEKYEEERPLFGGIRFNFIKKVNMKLWGRIFLYVIAWLLLIIPMLLIVISEYIAYSITDIKDILKFINITGIVGLVLLFIPLLKNAFNMSIPIVNKIGKLAILPSYVDVLGTRESISKDIKVLLKSWIPDDDERIVIFVEDCDRCSVSGIMEIFESIHLFLDIDKVYFVFAIDDRLLYQAIKEYYGDDNVVTVEQFLQKYVQEKIFMRTNDYSKIIQQFKNSIEPHQEKRHCLMPDEYSYVEQLLRSEKSLTPRIVKRLFNDIVRLKNIYMSNSRLGENTTFYEVVAWYLFNYFNTDKAQSLRSLFDYNKRYLTIGELVKGNILLDGMNISVNSIWSALVDTSVYEIINVDSILSMYIPKTPISSELEKWMNA